MENLRRTRKVNILGISDSSVCGGASLMQDGKVTFSINEERLNRQKMSTGFPELSIKYILEKCCNRSSDIDRIFIADQFNYFKPVSTKWEGWLKDAPNISKKVMYYLSSNLSNFVGNSKLGQNTYYKLKRILTKSRQEKVRELLKEKFDIQAPVEFVDHHKCHAYSAYFTSGFKDATVITLDGGGDGLCSRVCRVKDGRFDWLSSLESYHSIGNYYAYVTKICGFTAHKHEGKITGLAAYGKPVYKKQLKKMIQYDNNGRLQNTGNAYFWTAVKKIKEFLPKDFKLEDLSASIQDLLEEEVVKYCEYWIKKSGISNAALVGGVFANVKLNQRIQELDCVDNIFVHPGMGDEGLCFGAACAGLLTPDNTKREFNNDRIKDVYLGPDYSEKEMQVSLDEFKLAYKYFPEVEKEIAKLLSEDFVVARFNGRMEYGPRALGNRSILYQPCDKTINDWLNKKLKRTEFMPFAPATIIEFKDQCFINTKGAETAAEFMTITFDCTEQMQKQGAGVVHTDGTARPQFVTEKSNLSFYKIIKEYHAITGNPSIINTSFNMHEEPIVCTPKDGIRGFLDGELDYLAIGNFIVKNPKVEKNHFGRPLKEI